MVDGTDGARIYKSEHPQQLKRISGYEVNPEAQADKDYGEAEELWSALNSGESVTLEIRNRGGANGYGVSYEFMDLVQEFVQLGYLVDVTDGTTDDKSSWTFSKTDKRNLGNEFTALHSERGDSTKFKKMLAGTQFEYNMEEFLRLAKAAGYEPVQAPVVIEEPEVNTTENQTGTITGDDGTPVNVQWNRTTVTDSSGNEIYVLNVDAIVDGQHVAYTENGSKLVSLDPSLADATFIGGDNGQYVWVRTTTEGADFKHLQETLQGQGITITNDITTQYKNIKSGKAEGTQTTVVETVTTPQVVSEVVPEEQAGSVAGVTEDVDVSTTFEEYSASISKMNKKDAANAWRGAAEGKDMASVQEYIDAHPELSAQDKLDILNEALQFNQSAADAHNFTQYKEDRRILGVHLGHKTTKLSDSEKAENQQRVSQYQAEVQQLDNAITQMRSTNPELLQAAKDDFFNGQQAFSFDPADPDTSFTTFIAGLTELPGGLTEVTNLADGSATRLDNARYYTTIMDSEGNPRQVVVTAGKERNDNLSFNVEFHEAQVIYTENGYTLVAGEDISDQIPIKLESQGQGGIVLGAKHCWETLQYNGETYNKPVRPLVK